MQLGIFGGTFDPIHIGHLRAAEEVAEKFKLEKVYFIPAGCPPHAKQPLASAVHRLAMTRLAVAGNPRFQTLDLEIKRPGKSYTIDTLRHLRRQHPKDKLFLIMGADQSLTLHTWQEAEAFPRFCQMIVMTRPGIVLSEFYSNCRQQLPGLNRRTLHCLQVSAMAVSSTQIRHAAKSRHSIRYLVPAAVAEYITQRRLYRA